MFWEKYKNYILLHITVFIWGFTAIIGKALTLDAITLVWHRVWIALIAIAIYIRARKISFKISWLDFFKLSGIGVSIALHWVCFYYSIKISNVSITLVCFSTLAFFTAIMEPIFFKRKISAIEIFCGIIVVLALVIIFLEEVNHLKGIIIGLIASILAAFFSVLNGKLVKKYNSNIASFYELLGSLISVSVYFLVVRKLNVSLFYMTSQDWWLILILGVICTAIPFVLSIEVVKKITPYTVNLAINLESVYGIIFAYLIFGEEEKMTLRFYIGAAVIITVVVLNAVLKNKPWKKAS